MNKNILHPIVFMCFFLTTSLVVGASHFAMLGAAQAHEDQQNQHASQNQAQSGSAVADECLRRSPEQEARFVEDGVRRREILEAKCLEENARPTTRAVTGTHGRMQDPGAFLEQFHVALYSGDWDRVYESFHPDVLISEMGVLENGLDSYFATHLDSEKELLKALSRSYLGQQITIYDGVAWATTSQQLRGTFEGREYNVHQVETMVLMNGPNGWKIRQVHWSHYDADHEEGVNHH